VVQSDFDISMLRLLEDDKTKYLSDLSDARGLTPLMLAVQQVQSSWSSYLRLAGANLARVAKGGVSIAHLAAAQWKPQGPGEQWLKRSTITLCFVHRYFPNLDVVDEGGCTPLMTAAAYCDFIGVFALLRNRANPCLSDNKGLTALHYVIMWILESHGYLEWAGVGAFRVIRLLLKHGVDANKLDENGMTPIMLASCIQDPEELCKLLEAGTDFTQPARERHISVMERQRHDEVAYGLLDNTGKLVAKNVRNKYSKILRSLWVRVFLPVGIAGYPSGAFFATEQVKVALDEAQKCFDDPINAESWIKTSTPSLRGRSVECVR